MRSLKTLYKSFRLLLATLALLAFQKPAYGPPAPSPDPGWQCLVSAVWHEARGETAKGKRAVLDVVENRARMYALSYCDVVAQPKQFPWYKKKGLVELTPETLLHYNQALQHGAVLKNENFVFFNKGFTFGTKCVRIGTHKFVNVHQRSILSEQLQPAETHHPGHPVPHRTRGAAGLLAHPNSAHGHLRQCSHPVHRCGQAVRFADPASVSYQVSPMTVGDLIEVLREFPQDLEVAYSLHSEFCLMDKGDIAVGTACVSRPDGWIQRERPDKPLKDYLVFPGN